MSVCRPARCLLSKTTSLPKPSPSSTPRAFHTSAPRPARRRPHYPNIKASDLKLLETAASEITPAYKPTEESLLAKKYTPSQLAAIRAAEATVDPKDILLQGQRRTDPWKLPYNDDDLSEMDPVTDHAEKIHYTKLKWEKEVDIREATDSERDEAIAQIVNEQLAKLYPDGPPDPSKMNPREREAFQEKLDAATMQAALDPRAVYYSDENPGIVASMGDPRHSVVLPELPRIDDPLVKRTRRISTEEEEDLRQKRLLQYLGWDKSQLRRIRTKTLVVNFVTNQTRMGKIRSLYYLTIAGNMDGLLGVGEGKSVEPEEGRKRSIMAAIRNMRPVARYEGRTVYGDLERKVGATRVQLMARPPGFGLRTQHLIFEMARAAGLQDLAARVPRSRNKMNVVKATWEALTNQKLPEDIARARGKKLVDVRKVYYGASVH